MAACSPVYHSSIDSLPRRSSCSDRSCLLPGSPSVDITALPLPSAGLNPARTRALNGFGAPLTGQSYAQLLYVDRGSLAADLVISATQENAVTAVFAGNGSVCPSPSRPAPQRLSCIWYNFRGLPPDSSTTFQMICVHV